MGKVPKRPGVHTVTINGRRRRIQRLASGRVKFLKGTARTAPRRRKSAARRRSATKSTRRRPPAKRARRKRNMPRLGNFVDQQALIGGAVVGVASTLARNVPALGRFAPTVGLLAGGAFSKDPTVKKVANMLAGLSLGNAVLPGSVGGGGGLL